MPHGAGIRRRVLRSESGFTLIEVLVSALMLVMIATAAAGALIATSGFSGDERFRSQADQLAAQDLQRLQGLSDQQLNGLSQTRPVALGGSTYTVKSVSTFQDTSGNSGCASTAAAYYKTTSTVSWTENDATTSQQVVEESLLSRPVAGDLRAQVEDQTLSAVSGVTVAAAGPDAQSATTDSTGCVLFAGLTPGSYTVTVTDPGYITPSASAALTPPAGSASPFSQTVTVNTSGVAAPPVNPLQIGLPGSIVGTFRTASTGLTGEASALSWSGSGLSSAPVTGTNPATNTTTVSPSFTTGQLFPFDKSAATPATYTGNYSVWGGDCAQEQPPSTDQFAVIPGSLNTAQTIQEPQLYLGPVYYQPTSGGTTEVRPTSVSLTSSSTSGTICTDKWYPTLASGTGAIPPAHGWLANPGQPYTASPNLSACVAYSIGGKTYHAKLPTGNTSFTAINTVPTITIIQGTPANGSC